MFLSRQVPILNRASFEVRLLACVWLVAPGPPASSMTAWEDQQAQPGEWQDGEEIEPAGVPPSPGRPGARRGLQWGAGDDPKPPPATVSLVAVYDIGLCLAGDAVASFCKHAVVRLSRHLAWCCCPCPYSQNRDFDIRPK